MAGVVFDACREQLAPVVYKSIILFKKDRRGRRSLQDLIVVPLLSSVGEGLAPPVVYKNIIAFCSGRRGSRSGSVALYVPATRCVAFHYARVATLRRPLQVWWRI